MPLMPTIQMTCKDMSLGLLPELGGRIVSLTFMGEELLFMPPQALMPASPLSLDADAYKKVHGFKVYGGDKTWVAPEKEWGLGVPSVDLDAGAYTSESKDGVVTMTSPVCRETGLQVTRQIGFLDQGDIFLTETLRNTGALPLSKGIWNVTQIKRPFEVYMAADEGAVRSYHHENSSLPDPGLTPSYNNEWAIIPCEGNTCFKFGALLRVGRVAVMKDTPHGKLVWARVFDIDRNKPYAHGAMVEVFNAPWDPYGEIEVHSPLTQLLPQAQVSLTQLWRLYLTA